MRLSERGFTIVELIVAMAISAIIVASAGMTIVQITRGSEASQDLITVANQGHNVGYWLSRDIPTAQSINTTDDSGTSDIEFVIFKWKDWETGETYDIRYIWFPAADSLQSLKRHQSIRDINGNVISDKMILIADNIYTATLISIPEVNRWKLNVETHAGDKSVTREYIIGQRL